MKTIDAIREILSEIDPLHIDASQDAYLALKNLILDYDNLAPDWAKLPQWAQWYAIDANGDACAYAYEPNKRPEIGEWEATGRRNDHNSVRIISMESIGEGIDWRDCIWKRPASDKE